MVTGTVRTVRQHVTGPITLVIAVLLVEALARTPWRLPNPTALFLLVIAYSAFVDPRWKAWLVTVVAVAYGTVYFSRPGALFSYPGDELYRLGLFGASAPVMAWMTTSLKERAMALEREEAARRSAERDRDFVRLVIARAPVPVLVARGEDHEVVLANEEASKLLGVGVDKLERRPLTSLARADRALWQALDAARKEGASATLRAVTLHRAGGPPRTIEVSVAPLPDEDGRPMGVLVMAIDQTEQRRAEGDLARVRAELTRAERLAVMGAMVSGLAHEVRTPLTFISNHLHLLRSRLDPARVPSEADAKAALAHADEATQGVERINALVLDLRRYLRTESGPARPVQLEREVKDALRLFDAASRGRMVVDRELEPCPPILAEPLHVQQIVLNLLDNAAAFTPAGGRVLVRVAPEGSSVVLTVRDQGPGMPPEVKERIFDPLFTTKEEGTGLGLAIVRRLVETHGGAIDVETEVGRGTTFRVAFPIPRTVAVEGPTPPARPPPVPAP